MRRLVVAGLALSLAAFTAADPAFANPPNLDLQPGNGGQHGVAVGGPGLRGGGRAPGGGGFGGPARGGQRYGGDRRHNGGYGGAAVGAGLAGLAAGALLGGAIANQQPGYGYGPGYGNGNGYYAPEPVYADPGPGYAEDEPVEGGGPGDPAYCQQRYRSYDAQTGTYLGFDGARHPCP